MNPLDLYQDALDRMSAAILARDFDAYAREIDLPYLVHFETSRLLVTTLDELRLAFQALVDTLLAQGVTHYERVARSADYVQRDRIEGWHHTHLISNGEHVTYPHLSHHAIVRRGEAWRFSESYFRIKADPSPVADAPAVKQHDLGLTMGRA
ncbi:hypothetical protein [Tabrizicola sp.]|uniref:hypothetical protein n=1 Tax=Tabrizicola sp. TaxID=2005166 RepID=UPI002FDE7E10